jgi:hypothetical protein
MDITGKTRSKSGTRKDVPLSSPGQAALPLPTLLISTDAAENLSKDTVENIETHSDEEGSLDLITQTPALAAENLEEVVRKTTVAPPQNRDDNRAHVWSKLKDAQSSGDTVLAKILLKAYNDLQPLEIDNTPVVDRPASTLPIMSIIEAKSAKDDPPSGRTELEDNLVYAVGAVTSHQDIGFTPYFDDNIRKLKAPLPLTIFDRGKSRHIHHTPLFDILAY